MLIVIPIVIVDESEDVKIQHLLNQEHKLIRISEALRMMKNGISHWNKLLFIHSNETLIEKII